jgi:hypothetical protein
MLLKNPSTPALAKTLQLTGPNPGKPPKSTSDDGQPFTNQ